jgi:hypothetical protein
VLVATIVAAAALGACSDQSTTADGGVRPFSDVQASKFSFEADPTNPGRAVFHVTTTEPMICAIVWGDDASFGNFNNSLAMNGTGITRHDVFLPGAVPGRTYYFRVQGSTADGTLYESDTATFTIPLPAGAETTTTVDQREDLALHSAVLAVSSQFSDQFAATNAIDGSGLTEWASKGDGDDAFITIDLGSEREIAGVEFITRSMADGTATTRTFTATIDGRRFGPFPAGTPAAPAFADTATTGRTVRFDVDTSTGGNTGAVEVRVLAPAG